MAEKRITFGTEMHLPEKKYRIRGGKYSYLNKQVSNRFAHACNGSSISNKPVAMAVHSGWSYVTLVNGFHSGCRCIWDVFVDSVWHMKKYGLMVMIKAFDLILSTCDMVLTLWIVK